MGGPLDCPGISWHDHCMFITERYPHKPYIKEGFPRNLTVLVGSDATFECPLYADLSAFYQWFRLPPGSPSSDAGGEEPPNGTLIQVKLGARLRQSGPALCPAAVVDSVQRVLEFV